jgi:hypothetical protein
MTYWRRCDAEQPFPHINPWVLTDRAGRFSRL